MKDNLSELETKQMQIISKLQYDLRLKEFDISENRKEINELKRTLLDRKETLKLVINELEKIKRDKNYNKISFVLSMLTSSLRERQ